MIVLTILGGSAGKDRRDEEPPTKLLEPVCTRYIVSDITVESLAIKLQEVAVGY